MDIKKKMKIKNICCIGAGFVGGPTMAVIALKCPEIKITVVDKNIDRINLWNGDIDNLPVYEPGLSEIISKVRNVNLFFSDNIEKSIEESEMIFMAVNTPTLSSGEGKGYAADLKHIEESARIIAKSSNSDKIVIEKSTLPVRTAEKIRKILEQEKKSEVSFEVISNPEFLAEGTAINDLFKSDRVLIGGEDTISGKKAVDSLKNIYLRWIPNTKILLTNVWSAELSKLVSNAMLAQRISSINSISAICEKTGADIIEISKAVGMDSRIGKNFLTPSIGFGGSCFKKDILNLVYIARSYNLNEVADYWESVVSINSYQTNRILPKVKELVQSDLRNKTLTILGWAFKKNTNDSRESASIYTACNFLREGVKLNIYDPMIKKEKILNDIINQFKEKNISNSKIDKFIKQVTVFDDEYESMEGSNIILISTEWDRFTKINWELIHKKMNRPKLVVDGRNILNKQELEELGYKVYIIGKV